MGPDKRLLWSGQEQLLSISISDFDRGVTSFSNSDYESMVWNYKTWASSVSTLTTSFSAGFNGEKNTHMQHFALSSYLSIIPNYSVIEGSSFCILCEVIESKPGSKWIPAHHMLLFMCMSAQKICTKRE